ncbi:MAG: peptidoglycan DD-metalloendopeptidase family protein [Deltaproteobacteria bacterium]|nr:peptidoglycan DD-metalloendopeptidase family protein [Deltaproteobacteria bacterium]
MPGPVRNPAEAFQQLEAIMLRQMLQSSGAFRTNSSTPGAQLRNDMFVETLADAVAKAGGLGIAKMLQHDLGDASPKKDTALAPVSTRSPSGNPVDDLDDPNSEAPLPEDPSADSIDDHQSARGEVTGEVTSGFGQRIHPITGDLRFHTGIDLRAPAGAPIRAAAAGVVTDAGRRGGYGNTVEIDHGNGTTTLYAHASSVLVSKGQHVEPGQPVALVGQTGQATGPHLHFEVRRNDHPVNPASGKVPISIARALNRYRERAEALDAGTPFGARDGDKP